MPINLKAVYLTDPTLEAEGAWLIVPGGRLKVARWLNPIHRAALDRLREPFAPILAVGGKMAQADADAVNVQAGAEAILLGWESVEDDDGKAVPYSIEAASGYLGIKDLRDLVFGFSMNLENFRKARQQAIAGN